MIAASTRAPFIVGAARSGTTLLRLMLDASPEIAIPPETHFIPELARVWSDAVDKPRAFVEGLVAAPRWADYELDANELRVRVQQASDPGDALRAFYGLYAEGRGKRRWGDKTPPYVLSMPLIAELLEEAWFVNVIRDGRDAALSVRDLWFGPSTIEEGARWWMERVQKARRFGAEIGRYSEVRYEQLVQAPEVVLGRVCDELGLPYDERMLGYHRSSAARLRAETSDLAIEGGRAIPAGERIAIHSRTLHPPDPSRVERWRTEMTADEQRRFVAVAGDMLEYLGYPLS